MAVTGQQTFMRNVLRKFGLFARPSFPTFSTFVESWFPHKWLDLMAKKAGGLDTPDCVAMLELFYATYIVTKAGDPVFSLSSDLIQALRDTELPDVPAEEVKLPFEGINLDFPVGTLQPPSHEVSRFLLTCIPGDRFRVVYNHDDRTNYVSFVPTPGLKLHECLKEAEKNKWAMLVDPEKAALFKAEETYDDYWQTDMFRLAINTMLYITSPDSDVIQDKVHIHKLHTKLQGVKAGHKREVLLSKLARAKSSKRYIVGAKFRLSQEYQASLTTSGKKWVLDHKCRTMGHWKNQPCGSKSQQRKLIWISPYFRGPTFAEMVQKGYVVR